MQEVQDYPGLKEAELVPKLSSSLPRQRRLFWMEHLQQQYLPRVLLHHTHDPFPRRFQTFGWLRHRVDSPVTEEGRHRRDELNLRKLLSRTVPNAFRPCYERALLRHDMGLII